jgi:hypothetical protein
LDNYEELIFKLVNLIHLNDAQDELMYGIYQINAPTLLPFYKKFIINVLNSANNHSCNRPCFPLFDSGTGSHWQQLLIIKKLKNELNWNMFEDKELMEYFNDPKNEELLRKCYYIDDKINDIKLLYD